MTDSDLAKNPENQINFENSYKINRNSDEKDLYMKNDQKNITNPNMSFACMRNTSNIMNLDILHPDQLMNSV